MEPEHCSSREVIVPPLETTLQTCDWHVPLAQTAGPDETAQVFDVTPVPYALHVSRVTPSALQVLVRGMQTAGGQVAMPASASYTQPFAQGPLGAASKAVPLALHSTGTSPLQAC
jgi:hypothetical protein